MPFDQNLKRKTVVRPVTNNPNTVRIYVKGAPEFVIPFSTQTFDSQNEAVEFGDELKENLLEDAISTQMAAHGLKVISYAYKEISLQEMNELMCNYQVESHDFREKLESDLVYLGTFGLRDPIRNDILSTINQIKYGRCSGFDESKPAQVNVKLVTGDHMETAKYVALEAGIISHTEVNQPGICMTGEEFQE